MKGLGHAQVPRPLSSIPYSSSPDLGRGGSPPPEAGPSGWVALGPAAPRPSRVLAGPLPRTPHCCAERRAGHCGSAGENFQPRAPAEGTTGRGWGGEWKGGGGR